LLAIVLKDVGRVGPVSEDQQAHNFAEHHADGSAPNRQGIVLEPNQRAARDGAHRQRQDSPPKRLRAIEFSNGVAGRLKSDAEGCRQVGNPRAHFGDWKPRLAPVILARDGDFRLAQPLAKLAENRAKRGRCVNERDRERFAIGRLTGRSGALLNAVLKFRSCHSDGL